MSLAALAAFAGAPAQARTYEVSACDGAPGGVNNSWFGTASAGMRSTSVCPTQRLETRGIAAFVGHSTDTVPLFATANAAFDAPAGTTLEQVKAQFVVHRQDAYWDVGIMADSKMVFGCPATNPHLLCAYDTSWPGVTETIPLSGAHRVSIQTTCQWLYNCETDPHQPPYGERAGVHLYSAVVKIRDDSSPQVRPVDGAIVTGGWLAGSHYIGHAATDNTGIATTALYVDNHKVDDRVRDCDYTKPLPCTDVTYGRYLFNTRTLGDGVHQYRVEGRDAAGNVGSFSGQMYVDNTAPDVPTAMAVDGGENWRQANGFDLHWTNPASAAPITDAHYSLCNTATSVCTTGVRRADGISSISDLSVPEPGDYTLRLWLEDAAGNVNSANQSEPVHLRFDDVAPGEALPRNRNGWIGAVEAREFSQVIDLKNGETLPVSGIAGYSVTTDGSDPDATLDVAGDTYRINDLPEGIMTIKARAISGSGVASDRVGETTIRVDRTPPEAVTTGAPDQAVWTRSVASFDLVASDQPGLSGMVAALDNEPVDKGAFITYRVDSGEIHRAPGAVAHVSVDVDGEHLVTYHARDLAGNDSGDRSIHVRIDRTPPELVVFELPDPNDPRRVVVAASDRTSGIASGTIELRPVAGGSSPWRQLPTSRKGDRFIATIPDDSLTRGVYELRARIADRAGNEAIGDRRRDGSPARADTATLRSPTKLVAGLQATSAGRSSQKAGFVRRLTVPYGKGALAHGTLTTGVGDPVAATTVLVYARLTSAGAASKLIARVHTNRLGGFDYRIPSGPGRTFRFAYQGSPRNRAAKDEVQLRTRAAATLKSDRSRVRNREAVTFTGRLLGKPIPSAGKVLDLQALYRGKWRTFATPRAGRGGAWRYRYRFGATTGLVVYPFRIKIRAESAYPYVAGYSKVIKVAVTG